MNEDAGGLLIKRPMVDETTDKQKISRLLYMARAGSERNGRRAQLWLIIAALQFIVLKWYVVSMNVQTAIGRPAPVKLTVDDFRLLRNSRRFDGYSKAELFDGELLGVVRQHHDQPESDALVRINLTVEDYAQLSKAHAFAGYGRTELIDGAVYEMSPQHRPHGFVKDELAYRVRRALEQLGSSWQVATEQSVSLPPNNEPQPDVIVTTDPRGTGPIPGPTVGLLVEISASTVNFDLNDKLRVYAAANIPEYWVVDVGAGRIHQFWAPQADRYMQRSETGLGDVIEAKTIAQLAIDTSNF